MSTLRGVGENRSTPEMARYTVAEAADMLGITTGAVRNRLSLRTSRSTKEDRTVYVLLPADTSRDAKRDTVDTPRGMPHPEPDALTSELRDRLRYVEGQLEAERQAHAEARRLLVAALERILAIEAAQEASEAAETAAESRVGHAPRPGRPRNPHSSFIRPLFLRCAQSACSREKAKRPPY